jgi:CRISPR-associated protein Csb1
MATEISEIIDAMDRISAIRITTTLQPEGGAGTKVFPPTYSGENDESTYIEETRVLDGEKKDCVVLDSVQSQANRMEKALLRKYRNRDIEFPVPTVDFTDEVPEAGKLTVLEAPHRIVDAYFINSIPEDGDESADGLRDTEYGDILTRSSPQSATPLLKFSPTSVLFGVWDSSASGNNSRSNTVFARLVTSEIVAVGTEKGEDSAVRDDPITPSKPDSDNIYQREGLLTKNDDDDNISEWSEVGLGNIPAEYEQETGGITMEYAEKTTTVTVSGMRKLRFPLSDDREEYDDEACRKALISLALIAEMETDQRGYALRSRCNLVPEENSRSMEVVYNDGSKEEIDISLEEAENTFRQAKEEMEVEFMNDLPEFKPTETVVEKIKESMGIESDDS